MIESIVPQVLVHLFRSWPADECRCRATSILAPQLPWLHMHRATEYMNSHGKAIFGFPISVWTLGSALPASSRCSRTSPE